jgi:methylenetetrahydrofolate reductase (NADPH)
VVIHLKTILILLNIPMDLNHAAELVAFIKTIFPIWELCCAGILKGHRGTPNRLIEIEYLKQKIDAGADYVCTQLFFDNRDFYDFL